MTRAKSALALAGASLPVGAVYEDLCYYAQQASEKAIKAVYQYHGWRFRYTHNIEELLSGLKHHGLEIPQYLKDATALTDYAWATRYPSFGEPVTEEEYREALLQAETVVAWAEKQIPEE
jgi:HEPN domain-containing protein